MRRIVATLVIVMCAGLCLPSSANAAADDAKAGASRELREQLLGAGGLAARPSTQREFFTTFVPQAEIDRLITVWPLDTWVRKFREEKAFHYAGIFAVISDLEPEFNADATRATFRWDAVPDAPPGSSIAFAGSITLMKVGQRWYIADGVSDAELEGYRRIAKLPPDDEQALAKLIDESIRLLRAKNYLEYFKLTEIPSMVEAISKSPGGMEKRSQDFGNVIGELMLQRFETLRGKKLYGYELDKLAGTEGSDATGQAYGMFFVKIDGRWYVNDGGPKAPKSAGTPPGLAMTGTAGTSPPSIAAPSTPSPSTTMPKTPRSGYDSRFGRPGIPGLPPASRRPGGDSLPSAPSAPSASSPSVARGPSFARDPAGRFPNGSPSVGRPSTASPLAGRTPIGSAAPAPSAARSPAKALPADAVKVDDLPFPLARGAVDFKKGTDRISYESTADVDTVAEAISDALAKQGWQTTGRDLGKLTRIMKRSRGEATLSYTIHGQGQGSRISIGTRGLDWSAK